MLEIGTSGSAGGVRGDTHVYPAGSRQTGNFNGEPDAWMGTSGSGRRVACRIPLTRLRSGNVPLILIFPDQ